MHFQRPLLLALLLALNISGAAAESPVPAAGTSQSVPVNGEQRTFEDALERDTPRRSFTAFLRAMDDADHLRGSAYLDLRNLSEPARAINPERLAHGLLIVLQRALWVDPLSLSDDTDGFTNDGLPSYRDLLGRVMLDGREVPLYLQRVPEAETFVWKISNATVQLVPELYETYGYNRAVEAIYRTLPAGSFLGFELFKWAISIAVAVAAYGAAVLIGFFTARSVYRTRSDHRKRAMRFVALPFGLFVAIVSLWTTAEALGFGLEAQAHVRGHTLLIIATTWLIVACLILARDLAVHRLERLGRGDAVTLLRPASRLVSFLLIVMAMLLWLDNMGVNITALLAGLGVGGVAVALALQKPLEDVFGAMWLFTLQPIRVGDFCQLGQFIGTVEEIGLRRTRLRTLANTVVQIPNARIADEPIDNISARQRIWYNPTLRLRYDTSRVVVERVLAATRLVLESDDRVLEGHRVRFKAFASDALEIEISAYIATTDYVLYLEIAEALNLALIDAVERAGTRLAPPTVQEVKIAPRPLAPSAD